MTTILGWAVPRSAAALVDGFSDVADLPSEVDEALTALKGVAPERSRAWRKPEKTYMAIPVDLRDPRQREAYVLFAPYSIHAELLYDDETPLLVLDDTSTSVEVVVDDDSRTSLQDALPSLTFLRQEM